MGVLEEMLRRFFKRPNADIQQVDEPLYGWRVWKIRKDSQDPKEYRLVSLAAGVIWEPGKLLTSRCRLLYRLVRTPPWVMGLVAFFVAFGLSGGIVIWPLVSKVRFEINQEELARISVVLSGLAASALFILWTIASWFAHRRHREPNGDQKPVAHCSCGIYAFYFPYEMAEMVRECGFDIIWYGNRVVGRITAGGIIHQHGRGFRAQYAYPYELYVWGPNAQEIGQSLRRLYGVDVFIGFEHFAKHIPGLLGTSKPAGDAVV